MTVTINIVGPLNSSENWNPILWGDRPLKCSVTKYATGLSTNCYLIAIFFIGPSYTITYNKSRIVRFWSVCFVLDPLFEVGLMQNLVDHEKLATCTSCRTPYRYCHPFKLSCSLVPLGPQARMQSEVGQSNQGIVAGWIWQVQDVGWLWNTSCLSFYLKLIWSQFWWHWWTGLSNQALPQSPGRWWEFCSGFWRDLRYRLHHKVNQKSWCQGIPQITIYPISDQFLKYGALH